MQTLKNFWNKSYHVVLSGVAAYRPAGWAKKVRLQTHGPNFCEILIDL